jgi:hypothetical protein
VSGNDSAISSVFFRRGGNFVKEVCLPLSTSHYDVLLGGVYYRLLTVPLIESCMILVMPSPVDNRTDRC